MEYLSAYDWQPRENWRSATSLLLQDLVCGGMQIVFACVCTDNGLGKRKGEMSGYFTGRLQEWFYRNAFLDVRRFEEKFTQILNQIDAEIINWTEREKGEARECGLDFTGVFCVGTSFLIFGGGCFHVFALNTRYGRSALKSLFVPEKEQREIQMRWGTLEPGTGILLATAPFYENVKKDQISETLRVSELRCAEQLKRHLRELGNAARRNADRNNGRSADDVGAIAILARECRNEG